VHYTTLISVAQLQALRDQGAPLMVFDCSCDLMQPETGPAQYAQSHIAGALYAHLDNHLSAKGTGSHRRAVGRTPPAARA